MMAALMGAVTNKNNVIARHAVTKQTSENNKKVWTPYLLLILKTKKMRTS